MISQLSPDTLRAVPEQYQGIYAHGTHIFAPQNLVFLSGQIGVAADGVTCAGFERQCHQAMDNVEALLADTDMSLPDVLRVIYYVTDVANLPILSEIRQARWNQGQAPAVTTLVVAALAAPDLLVEIEVTAAR
ncbi:RidA family protein [uncultured Roseibium sp.]|uniref:RidA family protein n=1 Tax=uncultured Roseibium sp. TaxID=1936171 RepID=UPI00260D9BC7|nr:RidA family protein [uncultured Roseibium sp.]